MNDNNNSLSPSPFSVPGTVLGALHVLIHGKWSQEPYG